MEIDFYRDHLPGPLPNEQEVLHEILKAQALLAKRYAQIERDNGCWKPDLGSITRPDIGGRAMQAWIKDMFWRTTEELIEATELPVDLAGTWWVHLPTDDRLQKFLEEISDALHFLAEVSVVLGLDTKRITTRFLEIQKVAMTDQALEGVRTVRAFPDKCMAGIGLRMFRMVQAMGLAANCLKNKPWKQTLVPTDQQKFTDRCYKIWARFAELAMFLELDLPALYCIYFAKNKKNQARVRDGY